MFSTNTHLQLAIEDPYVVKVLTTLYMPIMCNQTLTADQIKAIDVLINVLEAFNYFSQNRSQLLEVKKRWEHVATKKNDFDKGAFDLAVALNTIINAYDHKNAHFEQFQKAMPLVIEILKNRKKQHLMEGEAIGQIKSQVQAQANLSQKQGIFKEPTINSVKSIKKNRYKELEEGREELNEAKFESSFKETLTKK